MRTWNSAASVRWVPMVAFVFGLGFWSKPAFDADLGFHLMGGAWISAHGAVPSADFINSFNPYWHDYHWLAQIVLFQLYRLGGYELLRFALGVLMGYLCKVVADLLIRSRRRPLPVALVVLGFLWSLSLIDVFVAVRPQVMSLCLLAVALRRMIQRPVVWELPFLFVLAVLAANMHVYWVLIPAFWGVYRCAPRFVRRRAPSPAYGWGGLLLLSAAALVSPYGVLPFGERPPFLFMNYALVFELMQLPPGLKNAIGEMKGSFANEWFNPWLIVVALVVAGRTFAVRRALADAGNTLAALAATALAVHSVKFVPVLAVAALPYLARHAGWQFWRQLPAARRLEDRAGAVALALLAAAAVFGAARHFPWIDDDDAIIAAYQPLAACRRVASLNLVPQPPRQHVRVLTHFNHGAWCRWSLFQAAPDEDFRVTTDGRTQGVPVEHYLASFDLFNATGGWREILAGWNPDVMVVSRSHQLAAFLSLEPERYERAYEDQGFVVFVPRPIARQ